MVLKKKMWQFIVVGMLSVFLMEVNAQTEFFNSFDNTKIAYSDEGDGPSVLLIHGFINTRKSWDKTALKRDLLAKGYRVIIPDLRGNGESDKPQNNEAYANDAEVKDLLLLVNHLKLDSYMAIGYSRGSILLAKLVTQETKIKKAVLGGMGIDFTKPNWNRRLLFAAAFNGKITEETEGAVRYAKSIDADLKSLHLQQKHQPVTSKKELSKISVPVLVIAGDEDLDNGNPKDLQSAIPNAILTIVTGNHNDTYKTASFSKELIKFLSN